MAWLNAIFALALAMVSMVCSTLLWVDAMTHISDQLLAAIIGAGLVGCQYLLLLANLEGLAHQIRIVAVVTLLAFSGIATAGWLESRYQQRLGSEQNQTLVNDLQLRRFNDLSRDIEQRQSLAGRDAELDYRRRAINVLDINAREDNKRQQIIHELNQDASPSAAVTLANHLGAGRWLLWSVLAVVLDVCPMLLFVSLARAPKRQPNSPQAPKEPTQSSGNDLLHTLQQEIAANTYGQQPAITAVMKRHNLRHPQARELFSQLIEHGHLKQTSANRFERT
jgi:hypothetical protein